LSAFSGSSEQDQLRRRDDLPLLGHHPRLVGRPHGPQLFLVLLAGPRFSALLLVQHLLLVGRLDRCRTVTTTSSRSNVITINVMKINVIKINVIKINVIKINVIKINVIKINVVKINVIKINARLSVGSHSKNFFHFGEPRVVNEYFRLSIFILDDSLYVISLKMALK
jgi:hypothetical protein